MRIGIVVPQGANGEYEGLDSEVAWARLVSIAKEVERLGFESIWVSDHLHTMPEPADELIFESFTSLTALAAMTSRVRLGHIVICAGFRNPALTAKMIATMDVISGGRMELGVGAGWKRDEWLAYGYGFPETKERLAALADHLEVMTRMLAPGLKTHATYEGRYASVYDAINLPKPLQQPRVPLVVGGSGPNVTWRLAAKYADELNVGGMPPHEVAAALPVIRSRCHEIGRDPATLGVSVGLWWGIGPVLGAPLIKLLEEYRALGVTRVIIPVRQAVRSDGFLPSLAEDARAAGLVLG